MVELAGSRSLELGDMHQWPGHVRRISRVWPLYQRVHKRGNYTKLWFLLLQLSIFKGARRLLRLYEMRLIENSLIEKYLRSRTEEILLRSVVVNCFIPYRSVHLVMLFCQIDQLMPFYVVEAMRAVPGLAGLFVAGIFSASLSTVSSSCNSLAAVTLADYISRWSSN